MVYGKFVRELFNLPEIVSPAEFAQKRVLAISSSYQVKAMQQLLDSICGFAVDVTGCKLDNLQELPAGTVYDIVIVIDGLECVRDFPAAIATVKALCKDEGLLFILARTPADDGRDMNFYHYEDYWRYESDDLKMLFSDCQWITAVEDDAQPYLAVKFVKSSPPEVYHTDTVAIYNCRWHKRMIYSQVAFAAGFFGAMKTLDMIGREYGTDKSSLLHHYLEKYEFFLNRFCDQNFVFMELGVFKGSSTKMWKKYFPKAEIIGVDIDPDCRMYEEDRIRIINADLGDEKILQGLAGMQASIIIDDASHFWSHQLLALFTLFPSLPSGGIYIMEDLGTSLNREAWPGYDDVSISGFDICSQIAEVVTGKAQLRSPGLYKEEIERIGWQTDMISFIKGSCILIKR